MRLDPVFTSAEAAREVGESASALYCHRWRKAGLIAPLGPRCGVFFNLLRDSDGPVTRRREALHRLLQRPVLVAGVSALYRQGWTPQRMHALEVVAPTAKAVPSLPDLGPSIDLFGRSVRWFNIMRRTATPLDEGFETVSAPMALADMLLVRHRDMRTRHAPRLLDWDDIDPETDQPWHVEVCHALLALGASREEADLILDAWAPGIKVESSLKPSPKLGAGPRP